MRVSIIVKDNTVVIDNLAVFNVDLSAIPSDVHAIQWYDSEGELEIVNEKGQHIENRVITDFSPYQQYVDTALRIKAEHDAIVAAQDSSEPVIQPTP